MRARDSGVVVVMRHTLMDHPDPRRDARVSLERVAMTQPAPPPTTPPPVDPAPAPTDPTPPPAPVPTPPADPADVPLGPAGKKALDAEREARKALEKRLAPLLDALGAGTPAAGGKSEVELLNERFAELERSASEERAARWRIEVAQAKNLTPEQAAWLRGSTQEELQASADQLLAAFPAAPPGPRNPAPDPSQGARGGQPGPDHAARVAELKAKGDIWGAVALERAKLQAVPRPT